MLARFLSVVSPLDFGAVGSILKTRMAWWPLLTLLSFTSSMSGSEFIAQRKLAFHVFGSQAWPSTYFPAECILLSFTLFSSKKKNFLCFYVQRLRVYSRLLTCVDGPLFEQTCVLVQLPAVSCGMLPGNGEHRLILQNTKGDTVLEWGWLHIQHRMN